MIDIRLKSIFGIRVIVIIFVMMVTLCALVFFVSIPISEPSSGKSSLAIPRDKRLEGGDCNLDSRKPILENVANSGGAIRPINRDGVKPLKIRIDGSAECRTSISASSFVVVSPYKIGNETRANNSKSYAVRIRDHVINHWLIWYSLIVSILMFRLGDAGAWGGMPNPFKKKHNAELSGASPIKR